MPRVNPLRSLANEQNLAKRIAFEREQRKMSYEGLAKRMGDVGYPIQASAIFKIEKGDPPRRITVDELVGFAQVFALDVSELLVPVELVYDKRARELYERQNEILGRLLDAVTETYRVLVERKEYVDTDSSSQERLGKLQLDQMRQMLDQASQASDSRTVAEAFEAVERGDHLPYPKIVDEALHNLLDVISASADNEAGD